MLSVCYYYYSYYEYGGMYYVAGGERLWGACVDPSERVPCGPALHNSAAQRLDTWHRSWGFPIFCEPHRDSRRKVVPRTYTE